jgi:hypothetical protein
MKFLLLFISIFGLANFAVAQANTNESLQNNHSNSTISKEEIIIAPSSVPEEKENDLQEVTLKKTVTSEKSANSKQIEMKTNTSFLKNKKLAATQITSRTPTLEQQAEMNTAIDYYKLNAPESFEYHYFTYIAGNYNLDLISHLEKAKELKPTNSDVIVQMAAYHTIISDTNASTKELSQLVQMGRIESDVLTYDNALLNSVSTNGVLLTHGFDDAFGSFYLQQNNNVRNDVKIVSLDLMQSKVYRDSLQKDGFQMPNSQLVDVQFFQDFCAQNQSKNLNLSLTFPKPYLQPQINQLEVQGLVYVFKNPSKNMASENQKIWKTLSLSKSFENVNTEKGKQLTANYLPMLFYLRDLYEKQNKKNEIPPIDKAIEKIGIQTNKLKQIQTILGK